MNNREKAIFVAGMEFLVGMVSPRKAQPSAERAILRVCYYLNLSDDDICTCPTYLTEIQNELARNGFLRDLPKVH